MKLKQVPLPTHGVLDLSGFYGGVMSGGNIHLKTFCDALGACPA